MNIEKFYSSAMALMMEVEFYQGQISLFKKKFVSYTENIKKEISRPQSEIEDLYQSLELTLDILLTIISSNKYSVFSKSLSIAEYKISSILGKLKIPRKDSVAFHVNLWQEIATGLQEIESGISITYGHLRTAINMFRHFDIKIDTVSDGNCEILIIIPRDKVKNNLSLLGQELTVLEKNLLVFSEIATGSREPVRVKTIASSEFSIFLESAPAIGACIALAVERIIALYKQSLEIKKIKLELEKHKVSDTISTLLDSHINLIVSAAAEKIAAEVMEQHAARLEESRKNELLIELRHSLENLAEKIDKGFQIEVSVAELGEEKKETGSQLTADDIARKQIAESAKKISYPIASGEPIPALPEKKEGEDE